MARYKFYIVLYCIVFPGWFTRHDLNDYMCLVNSVLHVLFAVFFCFICIVCYGSVYIVLRVRFSGVDLNPSSSNSHTRISSSNCTFDTIVVLVVIFIT